MKENKSKKDYFFYLGILGICLFLIMLGMYAIHFSPLTPAWLQYFYSFPSQWLSKTSNDPADWGTFGDFLGGTLNPIFGLLGFMLLIRTLSLQRQQLDDQRQAMQQQQEDMEAQRESLAISNKTQIKQQFEGTFFKLLQQLETEYLIRKVDPNDISGNMQSAFNLAKIACDELYTQKWFEKHNSINLQHLDINSEVDNIIGGRIYSLHRYFAIIELLITYIYDLNYPNLQAMSQKDKNFYVDLLLINLNNDAFTLFYVVYRTDAKIVKLLKNLGCLRTSQFSPRIMPDHPVAQLLKESYGEQAFRPIEVPPVNN